VKNTTERKARKKGEGDYAVKRSQKGSKLNGHWGEKKKTSPSPAITSFVREKKKHTTYENVRLRIKRWGEDARMAG